MMLTLLSLVLAQADVDGGFEPLAVDAGVVASASPDAGAGESGPADARGEGALTWTPIVDAFGEFQARFPRDAAPNNTFTVPRVQLGVQADWRGASGRVLLEGVYATQGGALIGVAGDSVVVRIREAWGGYRWRFLEAQLGLIPTLVVPEVERAFLHRELSPDGLEAYRVKAPADFGGLLRGHLPAGYGWVGVSVTNGEGYTSRELNTGKNVELAAAVHPLPRGVLEPLTVLGFAMVGTSGPSSARANRFGGGALWQGKTLGLGVTAASVQGWLDDGSRQALLVQGFARAELFGRLLLAARVHLFNRDTTQPDQVLELIGGVGVKVEPVELFLAVHRTSLSGAALTALPGVDSTDVRLVVRVRWPPLYP
ncbi:MAG: hypothetical protein SFW67_27065 [Myxococcaceae bacterium]|nr:hypothetical protein [Myxococcaceae bacterium]